MATAPTPHEPLPIAPSTTDPGNFDERADAFLLALEPFGGEMDNLAENAYDNALEAAASASAAAAAEAEAGAVADAALVALGEAEAAAAEAQGYAASALNSPGTQATSTTSLVVGAGAKTITVQTGKNIAKGQWYNVARTAAATTTWMLGQVSAYNSATGQLDFTVGDNDYRGSGTYTDWTVSNGGPRGLDFGIDAAPALFGDGSDGDVTVSGAVSLSRDMYYDNLTVAGAGAISTNGWRIFVRDTLDLTAAPAGAIKANGGNGGNGSAGTTTPGAAGAAGAAAPGNNVGAGGVGVIGALGSTNSGGINGGAGNSGSNGGAGGAGGDTTRGPGGGTAIGTGGAGGSVTAKPVHILSPWLVDPTVLGSTTLITGGGAGGSGAAGGGQDDGDSDFRYGGSAGGSGGGGGVIQIFARQLNRGASTAAGAIQAKGGNGGAGGAGAAGTAAGGAGAGGGGGGWVYIVSGEMEGASATGAVDVSGGSGGTGGSGLNATYKGGGGGGRGASGRFTLWNLSLNTRTESSGGVAAGAKTTTADGTGAAGQAATAQQYNL